MLSSPDDIWDEHNCLVSVQPTWFRTLCSPAPTSDRCRTRPTPASWASGTQSCRWLASRRPTTSRVCRSRGESNVACSLEDRLKYAIPKGEWFTYKYVWNTCQMAVVVAQLVERSLPRPEVRGSNPVIGKSSMCFLSTVLKRQNKFKRP